MISYFLKLVFYKNNLKTAANIKICMIQPVNWVRKIIPKTLRLCSAALVSQVNNKKIEIFKQKTFINPEISYKWLLFVMNSTVNRNIFS